MEGSEPSPRRLASHAAAGRQLYRVSGRPLTRSAYEIRIPQSLLLPQSLCCLFRVRGRRQRTGRLPLPAITASHARADVHTQTSLHCSVSIYICTHAKGEARPEKESTCDSMYVSCPLSPSVVKQLCPSGIIPLPRLAFPRASVRGHTRAHTHTHTHTHIDAHIHTHPHTHTEGQRAGARWSYPVPGKTAQGAVEGAVDLHTPLSAGAHCRWRS